MSCEIAQECFIQREAFEQPFEFDFTGTGTKPDWSSGTYRAIGASNEAAFKKAFVAAGTGDYLFEVLDAPIKSVSDFPNNLVIVPLDEDDTNTPTDIWLGLYSSFATYNKPIKIVQIKNAFNNVNTVT